MSKRLTRGWLVRAGIASAMGAAALLAVVTLGGSQQTTQAAVGDFTMAVSGGGGQPIGGSFNVNINATNNVAATWAGWNTQVSYNPAIVTVNSTANGGLCSGSWGSPQNSPTVQASCAFATDTNDSPPPTEIISFKCVGAGTSAIHLVTLVQDPVGGSTFFDSNAINFTTDLVDGSVTCQLPVTKSHTGGAVLLAGTTTTYTVHIGGNAAPVSSLGHVVNDNVPAPLTGVALVSSTNGALDSCVVTVNNVKCSTVGVNPDPGGWNLVFTANIPLSAAGTNGICNFATLDSPTGGQSLNDCFNVAPTNLIVSKVADAPAYVANDPISWTVTLTNGTAANSTATGVVLSDLGGAGWVATGGSIVSGPCTGTGPFTTALLVGGASCVVKVTGTVNNSVPANQTCTNGASATATNGNPSNVGSASTSCKPPFTHVQFNKSTDTDVFTNPVGENLFLCADPDGPYTNEPDGFCDLNGQGHLDINEIIVPITVAGSDPQGVGAFEFQVKYDNHIFDITICEGSAAYNVPPGCLAAGTADFANFGDATHWLYSSGRRPGDVGIGGCAATIITENDIRFGCVSKNPTQGASGCLGPDNATNVPEAQCGVNDAGVAATIHVTPKADLSSRITPGNDNGAIRTLLDEGCEVADIWGHPLSKAATAYNPATQLPNDADGDGYDQLGREIPLPGILPGGLVADCGDLTITVRVLEGDMNKDCEVNVTDDQIEASHYGAFFGVLLYQPWYDLEPALKDGDVDIKDLQKVFGRNGSTCENPIPPQPPLPDPDP